TWRRIGPTRGGCPSSERPTVGRGLIPWDRPIPPRPDPPPHRIGAAPAALAPPLLALVMRCMFPLSLQFLHPSADSHEVVCHARAPFQFRSLLHCARLWVRVSSTT